MILKGSQRSGAKQLGLHLLKTEENEHVELHDIRGFMSDDVVGALREAEAIAKGTKCRQFMFSVSLNPPENERVHVRTFEKALEAIEEKNGLTFEVSPLSEEETKEIEEAIEDHHEEEKELPN